MPAAATREQIRDVTQSCIAELKGVRPLNDAELEKLIDKAGELAHKSGRPFNVVNYLHYVKCACIELDYTYPRKEHESNTHTQR